nr:hypothetical protein [Dactylosporangium roseum]
MGQAAQLCVEGFAIVDRAGLVGVVGQGVGDRGAVVGRVGGSVEGQHVLFVQHPQRARHLGFPAPHRGGRLGDGGIAPQVLCQPVADVGHQGEEFAVAPGCVQRPAVVPDVALQRSREGGRGVRGERHAAPGVEPFGGLDERERRDLADVLGAWIAAVSRGDLLGEPQMPLDKAIAQDDPLCGVRAPHRGERGTAPRVAASAPGTGRDRARLPFAEPWVHDAVTPSSGQAANMAALPVIA